MGACRGLRTTVALVSVAALLAACDNGPNVGRGFSLPQGDVERGKQVFLYTGCLSCHVIDGIDSDIAIELEEPVRLGGKVARVKTYGELVTAVINPSHRIAEQYRARMASADGPSPMRNYNDILTVSQLIDLVTFLETRYELDPYQATHYTTFYP